MAAAAGAGEIGARGAAAAGRRRLLVILHGQRIEDDLVRRAIAGLKDEGHTLTVRVTWDSGDVDAFVREAVELWGSQRYDALVAGGGDGTLNEVVAAMLKHGAPRELAVAQLPLGTANDLACAAGISLDPAEALRLALDPGTARPVDVALVNGQVFMNLATAGPVSEVSSKDMSPTLKRVLGPAAVAVAAARQLLVGGGLRPIPGVVLTVPTSLDTRPGEATPDEMATLRGDLLVLAAGAARQMGRMVNVCPDALLDDGLLDVTLLFGASAGGQARVGGSAMRAAAAPAARRAPTAALLPVRGAQVAALASDVMASGLGAARSGLRLLRVPWMLLEAPCDVRCNVDGEPTPPSSRRAPRAVAAGAAMPHARGRAPAAHAARPGSAARRLLFEVLPRRLRLHLPDARLLVEGQGEAAAAKARDRHWWQAHRRRALNTGSKPRPGLLLDLWRAQQPPGRLSRALPGLRRLLGSFLRIAGLLALGWALGYSRQGAAHSRRGGGGTCTADE
ncbi:lipid kinase YegS-like [Scenedesmus sp. PABB004]|nr:lipid kinase YegS-like [Scenedesmus sp. PABB004]